MLYKHEYKILLKIKENSLVHLVEYGINKHKFIDMLSKGLIRKEFAWADSSGRIYFRYKITRKGRIELKEYIKNLPETEEKREINLDLKDVIDYLLDIKEFESKPGNKYDIYRLLNKKYLTIHEVGKHPLGKTFRFELTESGEKAYEDLLERI